MALQKLLFRPGVNRDSTNYNNEGGWYECDKIRFVSGSAEKIGGWAKYTFEELIGRLPTDVRLGHLLPRQLSCAWNQSKRFLH
jgi:hypothetical protein